MFNYKKVDKLLILLGYLYLAVPISIQLFFWFNRLISIPLIILLYVGLYFVIKKFKPLNKEEYKKIFNVKKLIIFFILIVIFNFLSGSGGFMHQNWDYHGRNAILHDLIDNSWPVKYDYSQLDYEKSIFGEVGLFTYYFTFWIPAAIVGKITNFTCANIFMFFWQLAGISLFFYYVFRKMKDVKYRYFLVFVMFSGLNTFAQYIMNYRFSFDIDPIGVSHVDTSTAPFCMSSFITQWFWVFNQSIPAWIITMLFLQEKDYKICGYQFALLVPYAPFPMLGFLYIAFTFIIFGKSLNKIINFERIKELISIPNFFGVISIMPIVYMFSLNQSPKGSFIMTAIENGKLKEYIITYLLYIIIEFLIYIFIVNKKNYKELIMCFLFFAVAPLFYIGGGCDLGNRSTIPLLIYLYYLIIEFLNTYERSNIKQNIIIGFLLLASLTNFNEIYRSLTYTYNNYKNNISNLADSYLTFSKFENKECSIFIRNFVSKYDKNNKVLNFMLRK